MCSTRIEYEIQEFEKGDWVKVAWGSNRDALIYLAHRRAIESGAPPIRVMATVEKEVVYKSWARPPSSNMKGLSSGPFWRSAMSG